MLVSPSRTRPFVMGLIASDRKKISTLVANATAFFDARERKSPLDLKSDFGPSH